MQQAVGQFNGTPSPNAHYVFSLSFKVSTLQSQEAWLKTWTWTNCRVCGLWWWCLRICDVCLQGEICGLRLLAMLCNSGQLDIIIGRWALLSGLVGTKEIWHSYGYNMLEEERDWFQQINAFEYVHIDQFELAMLRVDCEGFPCQHKRSKRFWICRPKFWNWLVWRSSMANVKLWAHFLRELFSVTVVTWAFREL